jgi:hypothetical protein
LLGGQVRPFVTFRYQRHQLDAFRHGKSFVQSLTIRSQVTYLQAMEPLHRDTLKLAYQSSHLIRCLTQKPQNGKHRTMAETKNPLLSR